MKNSARQEDVNGYWLIAQNPISRAGVFPYMGYSIPGAPEPFTTYMVYRPEEELARPETIESCKLIPFIDEHAMLGTKEGHTPAEQKGVAGVTGENVFVKDGVLYAPLKVFSETVKDEIESGKKELSLGYYNDYEPENGVYQGVAYQFKQTRLRANHLALVHKGRCDVAVLDSLDTVEAYLKEQGMDEKKLMEFLQAINDRLTALEQKMEAQPATSADNSNGGEGAATKDNEDTPGNPAKDESPNGEKTNEPETKASDSADAPANPSNSTKDEENADKPKGEPATPAKDEEPVKTDGDKETAGDKGISMDEAMPAVMRAIAHKQALVEQVLPYVGTFDHAPMTAEQVAVYACKKLGLHAPKGQETAMLQGFLTASAKAAKPAISMDGAMEGTGGKTQDSLWLTNYLKN